MQGINDGSLTFSSSWKGWSCHEICDTVNGLLQTKGFSISLPEQMSFHIHQSQDELLFPTEELMRYFAGSQHGKPVGVSSSFYTGSIEKGFWSVLPYASILEKSSLPKDIEYAYIFIPTYFVTCSMLQIMLFCAKDDANTYHGKHYLYRAINHLEKTLVDALNFILYYIGNGNIDPRLEYFAMLVKQYFHLVFDGASTNEVFPSAVRKAFEELIIFIFITMPEETEGISAGTSAADKNSVEYIWNTVSELEAEIATVFIRNDPYLISEMRAHQNENPEKYPGKGR